MIGISKNYTYFVLASVMLLTGCASWQLENPENEKVSLVVLYVDMSESSGIATSGYLHNTNKKEDEAYYYVQRMPNMSSNLKGDVLITQNADQGVYHVYDVIGGSTKFQFPEGGDAVGKVKVGKQGVYFMGSYKLDYANDGMLGSTKFNLMETKRPTEKEILAELLKNPWVKKGKWRNMIQAKLNSLK